MTHVERLAATVERLRRDLRAARAEADERAALERAVGILTVRLGCGPDEALGQLELLAQRSGVPPAELATDIARQVTVDARRRLARDLPPIEVSAVPAVPAPAGTAGVLTGVDVDAAARALWEQALRPMGVTAVAIWAVATDGSLTLAAQNGFGPVEAGRWHHVPPGVRTLARRALTERRPVWSTEPGGDAPSIGGYPADGAGTRVALPAETAGRVLGMLEACWPGPIEPLSRAAHRQLDVLAALCAYPLLADRTVGDVHGADGADSSGADQAAALAGLVDGLLDPAMVLRLLREPDGGLLDFRIDHVNPRFADPAGRPGAELAGLPLLEAYPWAAVDGGLLGVVEHVYATGEPRYAERVVLTAFAGETPVSVAGAVGAARLGDAVLLTWRLDDETTRLAALLRGALRLGRIGGFEDNLVTGETTWNTELFGLYGLPPTEPPIPFRALREHAHPDDAVAAGRLLRTVLHHLRPASAELRLRRPDGVLRHLRVVAEPVTDAAGLLIAVRGACQDISAQHRTETALAVTQDRLAHSEQESAERDRLALRLQQAIMPPAPAPLDVSGLDIAVRYRPAEQERLVGGDWYDAVVLPDRRVLLAVGDVAGHGIDAATDMVALRNALRGLAVTGSGPARLLHWLNAAAHNLAGNVTATAICGVYDPTTRTLRWARAGHLPPILLRDGAATQLPLPGGPLLGAVSDVRYQEKVLRLRQGDTLLMYTDGLIERRDHSLDVSLKRLLTLAEHPAPRLADRLDHLLTHCHADTDDDACLIGIHMS